MLANQAHAEFVKTQRTLTWRGIPSPLYVGGAIRLRAAANETEAGTFAVVTDRLIGFALDGRIHGFT